MTDCLCILCHLTAEKLIGIAVRVVNCIKTAGTDTTAAALAFIIINDRFFLRICNSVTSAFLCTAFAAAAKVCFDNWFTTIVLSHFSGTTSAAHTNILDCAAETGGFMSLEMSKTDEYVSVHYSTADSGSRTVFCIFYRNLHVIGTAKSVTDNDLTTSGDSIKAIQIRTIHVLQGIFAASRIKGVTVSKKRHSSKLLTKIGYYFCIIGAQESKISKFSEMHFDGHEFTIHINVFDSGCNAQFFQLVQLACADLAAEVGEIYC